MANSRKRRKQRPKRAKPPFRPFRITTRTTTTRGKNVGPPPPGDGSAPPGYMPNATELSQPLPGQPDVSAYPAAEEQHAVTTNQEPKYSWPPVDIPPLQGFTVGDHPIDNGQAYMETAYDPAPVDEVPFYDFNGGNTDAGDTGQP